VPDVARTVVNEAVTEKDEVNRLVSNASCPKSTRSWNETFTTICG